MRQPTSPQAADYVVEVGRIVGAHSLGGEVRVESYSDVPGRFSQLDIVYLRPKHGPGWFAHILGVREHTSKGLFLLKLSGVEDRTQAEKLRDTMICITAEDSPQLPEGEYWEYQILGLEVVTTTGRSLGPVREIYHTGANDVYATPVCLIPAIPDVIREINLQEGRMVIEAIPGLLPDEEPAADDADEGH